MFWVQQQHQDHHQQQQHQHLIHHQQQQNDEANQQLLHLEQKHAAEMLQCTQQHDTALAQVKEQSRAAEETLRKQLQAAEETVVLLNLRTQRLEGTLSLSFTSHLFPIMLSSFFAPCSPGALGTCDDRACAIERQVLTSLFSASVSPNTR